MWWQPWLLQAAREHLKEQVHEWQPKAVGQSCVQPQELGSGGVWDSPREKELLPGFPWGADSKLNSSEGGSNNTRPRAAQGCMCGSRRGRWEDEPPHLSTHLPLEGQQVESVADLQGRRTPDWLRHPCDGKGWGILPGTDGTPSWPCCGTWGCHLCGPFSLSKAA